MKNAFIFATQILILIGLNKLGYWITGTLNIPVPGNVVGMIILFIFLMTGVVKLAWIEIAASFLIRHLAFFFIPIAIGLMDLGHLFLTNGFALIVALIVSLVIGMISTGFTAQGLSSRGKKEQHESSRHAV